MADLSLRLNIYGGFSYDGIEAPVADQARAAAKRIRGHQKAAAVEIGRELVAMKKALGHGNFLKWVENELEFTPRTATNLMSVATTFGDPVKWASVSHLPPAVLYKLASPSTPEAVRETVFKIEPGHRVSPGTLKSLIEDTKVRQARKERRRREQDPTPEEVAKAKRREKMLARERAQRQAEDDACAARAIHCAEIIKRALGDDLQRVIDLLEGLQGYDLKAALLGKIEAPGALAA